MEIFALRFRTVDQIIPLIRPLVPPPGTVTGLQNQLIVRSTPQNIAEIRAVLDRIDVVPRRLLITVRQQSDSAAERDRVGVSGTIAIGRAAEVSVDPPAGRAVDVDVVSSRRTGGEWFVQLIQALEGQPAFIQTGQLLPVPSRQVVRGPSGSQVVERVEYLETGTGFTVLPRLAGDQVFLDILPQRESANAAQPGTVSVQRIATTVAGRLGEWIDLGGSTQRSDERGSVILGRTVRSGSEGLRVQVRVEELR